jgi:uncharacterized protein with ParB-like and HNH nuclease domain
MLSIENPKAIAEEELEDQAENDLEDTDEALPFNYSITSYGADYPTDGLVKRLDRGDIYVPDFQRGYVWKLKEASRFIESLLLGLPVPGIFLSKETETQKLLVIDGQQRLRTIQYFYNRVFEPTKQEFALDGISPQFNGKTYNSLSEEDRRRLDDSIIPATVIKQDEPSEDQDSIYQIFERLNTGGVKLQAQEIRACIYHGEFNELIKELNNHPEWRNIYGRVDARMKDQELLLRFLALYFRRENYNKPMKAFLNKFMGANQKLKIHSAQDISSVFVNTIELISYSIGNKAFRLKSRRINAAIFDAVMVGLALRLKNGEITNKSDILSSYKDLLQNSQFLDASVNTARTTETTNVKSRLDDAIKAFANVV